MTLRSSLDLLTALPADPLLGITTAFRADARTHKLDLGVGVYRDPTGITPVMRAVKAAETQLLETQKTKVYEGPAGNLDFDQAAGRLSLGDTLWSTLSDRVSAFATPGGCGALRMGSEVLYHANPQARIWLSNPTWANHAKLVSAVGFELANYEFLEAGAASANVDLIIDSLADAAVGDIVLLQGPCHNPTGVDLTEAGWNRLAEFLAERGLIPFIDVAYQGLGRGIEEDMGGVRALLRTASEAVMSVSMSKNFGLYRERTGAVLVLSRTPDARRIVDTHLASIARELYSMPPAHGAAIVATILNTPALAADWRAELDAMRTRINGLRVDLSEALAPVIGADFAEPIAGQRGMFSLLPVTAQQAQRLMDEQAVYMPSNGRINIAGLDPAAIARLSEALRQVL